MIEDFRLWIDDLRLFWASIINRQSFVVNFFVGFVVLMVLGCSRQATGTPIPTAIVPTMGPLPTLLPTFTPLPDQGVLPSPTPLSTLPRPDNDMATPVPFDEVVVSLQYQIPELGLNRRLEGNAAGQIVIVDEATGVAVQRNNQSGILIELQQGLQALTLAPLPADCTRCVQVTYSLPLADLSDDGWLQDSVLLASIENFMAVALGPHFPPQTTVGLRRSASPYWPAHTIAFTGDGRLWQWLATEAQVDVATVAPALNVVLSETTISPLADRYEVACPGAATERLQLNLGAVAKTIRIVCPEFALPAPLQDVYVQLDALLLPKLADAIDVPKPPAAFPLTAVVDYKRVDDSRLTIYQNSQAVAIDASQTRYTTTLSTNEIVSVTTSLLNSGQLRLGLNSFQPEASVTTTVTAPAPASIVVVRGPNGVYDGVFADSNSEVLASLDVILATLIGGSVPDVTATPTVETTATAPIAEPLPTPMPETAVTPSS